MAACARQASSAPPTLLSRSSFPSSLPPSASVRLRPSPSLPRRLSVRAHVCREEINSRRPAARRGVARWTTLRYSRVNCQSGSAVAGKELYKYHEVAMQAEARWLLRFWCSPTIQFCHGGMELLKPKITNDGGSTFRRWKPIIVEGAPCSVFGCPLRRPRHPVWPDVHLFETGKGATDEWRERGREGRTDGNCDFCPPSSPFLHPSSPPPTLSPSP